MTKKNRSTEKQPVYDSYSVAILGFKGSGKTSLALRYVSEKFEVYSKNDEVSEFDESYQKTTEYEGSLYQLNIMDAEGSSK